MNVQWIQAHVVQERVWIWTALTGVSAHLATISTRKPVKVQQTKASPFCIIVNRQVKTWQIKTQISEVIKSLHAGVNLTSGMAENTYLQHGHTHSICIRALLRCTGRESTISSPPPSLQLPCCYTSHPLPLFTCGSGPKPEHSDCLYSGADEEIFGRLQHIPAMCSVLGSREEKHWILSISNRSSWSLQWANMWHRGYSRKYACVQLSTSEIIFCFNHMWIDHDIPMWPHPCSYESSSKKKTAGWNSGGTNYD